MYEAYLPFNVPLSNFQLGGPASNAAETIVTVKLGEIGTCKFAFDRTESSFSNFTEEAFQSIPKLLAASTNWIRPFVPSFKVASHQFLYSNHSLLKEGAVADFLAVLNPRNFKNGGKSIGNGAIFNQIKPDIGWQTQIMLDRSMSIQDGLFMSLGVTVKSDNLDYDGFFADARRYFDSVLSELGLRLPNSSR